MFESQVTEFSIFGRIRAASDDVIFVHCKTILLIFFSYQVLHMETASLIRTIMRIKVL